MTASHLWLLKQQEHLHLRIRFGVTFIHVARPPFSLRIAPSCLCVSVAKYWNERQDLPSPPPSGIRQQACGQLVRFRPVLRTNTAVDVSTFSLPHQGVQHCLGSSQALHHGTLQPRDG